MDFDPMDRDCTLKCHSSTQCQQLLSYVPYATASQMRSVSVTLCHNFASIRDTFGRNLLHLTASCGKWEIVEWLLNQCGAEIDIKDMESGWTALHRSFFYGQLTAARVLCMKDANMKATDHEGFTPLDIIAKDRLPHIEYLSSYPSEVYVWGSNFNYNLGLVNSQGSTVPETLECFRKASIDIKQVSICEFHSTFLTLEGHVFTCGQGWGGRLGRKTEDNALVPTSVEGLDSETCIEIAAGRDHLLLLLQNGQIRSCGLNSYHQLGHIPAPEKLLTPECISPKFFKGKVVIGVRAARFHSIIFTKDSIFTFGLNAGQLGHLEGDQTQIIPRQVSIFCEEECHLTHVETSDGAIACATKKGDIYILHEYKIRKIASKQLEISKLSMVGGHLDSRCNIVGINKDGGLELRVALLTNSGKLFLWRQTDPYLRRCIFSSTKEILLSDMHLNNSTIGLITLENEGYLGRLIPSENKHPPPPSTALCVPMPFRSAAPGSKSMLGFTVLLNREDCHLLKVKRLAHIYRGTKITSDSKGRNFAILQVNPKMGLVEIPFISNSKMVHDFSNLYFETQLNDDFHDIVIKVGQREFAAHKFILASKCGYFRKHLSADMSSIALEDIKPEAFEQVLKFIYTNHCDFLSPDFQVNWGIERRNVNETKLKTVNPVGVVRELSKRLGIPLLAKRLDDVKLVNGRICLHDMKAMPFLKFHRESMLYLCDVNLIASCGTSFPCHKCILIARLEYFHNMLGVCWAENSRLKNLTLPITADVMESLLEYLYTDKSAKVSNSDDIEFLCNILMVSDQLLVHRLKELCEVTLAKLISLKNAAELLELSCLYNSSQLKKLCMQFICINLAAVVESKSLDVLSEDVMEDLTTYYRNLIPSMQRRHITASCSSPAFLESLEKKFPVSSTYDSFKIKTTEGKVGSRHRLSSWKTKTPLCKKQDDICDDIVRDMAAPLVEKKDFSTPLTETPKYLTQEIERKVPIKHEESFSRVMKCLSAEKVLSLKEIMLGEELNLTPLQKKKNQCDRKPIPHLSQKQRKLIAIKSKEKEEQTVPNSPPNRTACPWAKLQEPSPPSPSFWKSVAKKDFQPSPLSRSLPQESSSPIVISSVSVRQESISASSCSPPSDIVISLHDIQKDEELKLKRSVNLKVKPLQILSIEDQAIEELLEMYHAHDNSKEKITVSRVQSENVASPVWKRIVRS